MFTKEAKAVGRAIDRKGLDFEKWLDEFHATHVETVRQAVAPACAMLAAVGKPVTVEHVAEYCILASRFRLNNSFNRETREQMSGRLERWSSDMQAFTVRELLGGYH